MGRVENLTFGYGAGGFRLRVPEFALDDGERVAVVGPSGTVVLADISAHMMEVGRQRLLDAGLTQVAFCQDWNFVYNFDLDAKCKCKYCVRLRSKTLR